MEDSLTRIEALETEIEETKDELKKILLDIRTYLMEAQTPIPKDLGEEDGGGDLEFERG